MDPGSQGVQGCPSPGKRGEGSGGCNRGDATERQTFLA